jgi:hypothetical protein
MKMRGVTARARHDERQTARKTTTQASPKQRNPRNSCEAKTRPTRRVKRKTLCRLTLELSGGGAVRLDDWLGAGRPHGHDVRSFFANGKTGMPSKAVTHTKYTP